jgi:hypothetical protein
MEIGIMGLPASGKTVIFNALSRARAPIASYSAPSSEPNRAVVKVPDERLDALAKLFQPQKVTPAEVRYVDVAGITRGSGGEGQGAPLIAQLRNADALLIVVRAFQNQTVPHPAGHIDPLRDIEVIATELMLADMGVVEHRLERLEKELHANRGSEAEKGARLREYELLRAIYAELAEGRPARTVPRTAPDEQLLRGYQFLTLKPWLIAINTDDEGAPGELFQKASQRWTTEGVVVVTIAGRLEMDLTELSAEEAAEFLEAWEVAEPALDRIIQVSYRLLDLISFFTVGEDEVRAWTIRRGASALEAAAAIHTSISKAFIRAEVVPYDQLLACGSLAEARRRGVLRAESRTYIVQDGDIAHFLHGA